MAVLDVVVQDAGTELPAAFSLVPHRTVVARELEERLDGSAQVLVVDGRTDLVAARDTCLRLMATQGRTPLLLLVGAQSLGLLSAEWGISDFVLDTAQPGEVEARVRLLGRESGTSGAITCGPVVVDEHAYLASVGGRPLELTYTEFELLKYLALHPGRVLGREQLLSEVWGYDYYGGTRTVDVHIRRLRAKLGPEYDAHISTVRNVGYRFLPTR